MVQQKCIYAGKDIQRNSGKGIWHCIYGSDRNWKCADRKIHTCAVCYSLRQDMEAAVVEICHIKLAVESSAGVICRIEKELFGNYENDF